MNAIEMLKIMSERTWEIDWQKMCNRVTWTELMKILQVTGIEWRGRRFVRILCMDQCVKLKLDPEGDKKSEDRRRS